LVIITGPNMVSAVRNTEFIIVIILPAAAVVIINQSIYLMKALKTATDIIIKNSISTVLIV